MRTTPTLSTDLAVRLATSEEDLLGAHRLRYSVFVEELGGDGETVDHTNRLEADTYDSQCDHLVLVDPDRDPQSLDHVLGVYRLMPQAKSTTTGFYCSGEYDLDILLKSGRRLLELGRSCLHPSQRGGAGLFRLWSGLAEYIQERDIEIVFGVASFHGTNIDRLIHPLSLLHHKYLAPQELRVTARPPEAVDMNLLPPERIDRRAAARAIPALLKSYLRLGGFVGEGAWVDTPFNTTDVCLVMDVSRVDARARALYSGMAD